MGKTWFQMEAKERGVTLIEILIVVVIVAILTSLAIPSFVRTVEKARDKEAKTVLKLVRTGEKIYRLEHPNYYPYDAPPYIEDDVLDINTSLRLDLDPDADTNPDAHWDYQIQRIAGPPEDFNATAERSGSDGRWWHIKKDDPEPVAGAGP